MGLFEFLMILVSVIIGLAMSEILVGVANLLRERSTVRFHWLHLLFQAGVFFALIQQWWESWNLSSVSSVRFTEVLLLLLSPVALFLLAHLLYPRPVANANLEAYYYRQASILWSLVLAGTVLGSIITPLLRGDPLLEASNWPSLPVIGISVVLLLTKKPLVHMVLAPAVMLSVVLDTWLINPAISA